MHDATQRYVMLPVGPVEEPTYLELRRRVTALEASLRRSQQAEAAALRRVTFLEAQLRQSYIFGANVLARI